MKRVLLFLATNLAVLVLFTAIARIFGIDQYVTANGFSFGGLLIFAALFGMGGAFASLAMSKFIAKRQTGAQVIEQPQNEAERWLLATVAEHAKAAGIGMPK